MVGLMGKPKALDWAELWLLENVKVIYIYYLDPSKIIF